MKHRSKKSVILASLQARGFDQSRTGSHGEVHVRCSQCEALVVNGTPTHERGCPNATHECRGCNQIIPRRQQYCEDCA